MFDNQKKVSKEVETPLNAKLLKMGITLEDGEEVSEDTFEEFNCGKGDDNE